MVPSSNMYIRCGPNSLLVVGLISATKRKDNYWLDPFLSNTMMRLSTKDCVCGSTMKLLHVSTLVRDYKLTLVQRIMFACVSCKKRFDHESDI